MEDFGGELTPDARAQEERLRAEIAAKKYVQRIVVNGSLEAPALSATEGVVPRSLAWGKA
jgi:hypothetical protein